MTNKANILKALGEPTRLDLTLFIKKNEGCNQREILKEFNETTQANISKHLKELTYNGILATEKDGLFIRYYIANNFFVINLLNLLGEN